MEPKQALEETAALWDVLAENPRLTKSEAIHKMGGRTANLLDYISHCPACQYAHQAAESEGMSSGYPKVCLFCPVDEWSSAAMRFYTTMDEDGDGPFNKRVGICNYGGAAYARWAEARDDRNWEEAAEAAREIAQLAADSLRNLEG